jgi:hypothetical protein
VGYTTNHASDVFWFFKPDTRKVILSQDVTWLDKSKNIITIDFNDRIYDENEKDTKEIKKEKNKIIEGSTEYADNDNRARFKKMEDMNERKDDTKLDNELKRLNTFYNPTLNDCGVKYNQCVMLRVLKVGTTIHKTLTKHGTTQMRKNKTNGEQKLRKSLVI